MIPYVSPGGNNTFCLNSFPHQLLVGTSEGLFLLENCGEPTDWAISSRWLSESHIHAILMESSSGMLFAGIQKGGVLASSDFGRKWEKKVRGLKHEDVYTLNCAVVDGRPLVYAGTEPPHLFVSEDLGGTWMDLEGLRSVPSAPKWHYPQPPNIGHVKQIVFEPENPKTLYACIEQGALLRSYDGGV
ncbi:MAG: WD40/YVTN/BNR-like repeat-containing protein, partial [Gammaproteobacteria bacterium]